MEADDSGECGGVGSCLNVGTPRHFVRYVSPVDALSTSCSHVAFSQGNLAFGKEGRKASAGRPRIPADATIVFDVEIVGLPGKEVELIDLIGDV